MYIYNVTVKIDQSRADEWLVWMREKHIPDVMATGFFTENRVCRLVDEGDMEGITFAIQYTCNDLDDFLQYNLTKHRRSKKTTVKNSEPILSRLEH